MYIDIFEKQKKSGNWSERLHYAYGKSGLYKEGK